MSSKGAAYPQAERPGYSLPYAADPSGFGYTQPSDGEPIVTQPVGVGAPGDPGGFMSVSQSSHNIPHTLRSLTTVDQLLVHQKVRFPEVFAVHVIRNRYAIKYSTGQNLYYAVEESECLSRTCCGPLRPFEMKILDNAMTEMIRLKRPLACNLCCFACCLQKMEVSSPPGTVIGSIEQEWGWCTPKLNINNAAGDTVLKIKGPICTCNCCGDKVFKVLSRDGGTQVGRITREWAGCEKEIFRGASHFSITFPRDLDVKTKALIIGACFLISVCVCVTNIPAMKMSSVVTEVQCLCIVIHVLSYVIGCYVLWEKCQHRQTVLECFDPEIVILLSFVPQVT